MSAPKKLTKGEQILDYHKQYPHASRSEIALALDCTTQRVGEVFRVNGITVAPTIRSDEPENKKGKANLKVIKGELPDDAAVYKTVTEALAEGVEVNPELLAQAQAYARRTKRRVPK